MTLGSGHRSGNGTIARVRAFVRQAPRRLTISRRNALSGKGVYTAEGGADPRVIDPDSFKRSSSRSVHTLHSARGRPFQAR